MSDETHVPKTHNLPSYVVPIPDDIHAALGGKWSKEVDRSKELIAAAKDVPEEIKTEDQAKALSSLLKEISAYCKETDAIRVVEKKPFDRAADAVDGFFGELTDPLDTKVEGWKAVLTRRQKKFLDWKEEQKRIAREAEAAKAREEEQKRLEEAAAAEARRIENERLERIAREEAEAAERRKLDAIREAQEAEERKRKAQEEERQADARRKEQERLAKELTKKNEAQAVAMTIAAIQSRQEAEVARKRRDEEDRIAAEARKAAGAHKAEEREAEDRAKSHGKEARTAEREERQHMRAVDTLDRTASTLEVQAKAKPAELARTANEYGVVATLAEVWDFEVRDYSKVPLEELRRFMTEEQVDKLIWHYMRAGGRSLPGVHFFQTTQARIV